jgi:arabinofuranosyltransferase
MKKISALTLTRAAAVSFIVFIILLNSWVDEDAFVTYRAISNFISGYGLRFNIDERVQAFTHPLWLFVSTVFHFLTEDMFFTMIATGCACSLIALGVVFTRLPRDIATVLIMTVLLVFSRSFIHFSTSGLENSLTHLLCGLFAVIFVRSEKFSAASIFLLSLCAGLSVVNRLDSVLFFVPGLLYVLLTQRTLQAVGMMAAGLVPMWSWLLFSLVYYGFLFPNTYYAKVATDIPKGEVYAAGIFYFEHSLVRDPVTLSTILVAILAAIFAGSARARVLAAGVVLYLLYVVSVGADYMCGRFFSAAFFVAVCILATFHWRRSIAVGFGILAVTAAFAAGGAPIMTRLSSKPDPIVHPYDQIVVDTQIHFYQVSGLPFLLRNGLRPLRRPEGPPSVEFIYGINSATPLSPFQQHIADDLALADPLLARLPSRGYWRPGHFQRDVPAGYPAVLRGQRTELCDKNLEIYKQHLDQLTRGPLWTVDRLKTIVKMNTGGYDHLIDKVYYKNPRRQTTLEEFKERIERDWCFGVLPSQGLRIALPTLFHAERISTTTLEGEVVIAGFFREGQMLERVEFGQRDCSQPCDKSVPTEVAVPLKVAAEGYDAIVFQPYRRATIGEQSLGPIRFQ